MKPKYYIYSWQAGAFRSDELSKSLKGYSCRGTAERIAKFRFNGVHDRIRCCVALTDEEAFAEMTRQNQPMIEEDTVYYADGIAYRYVSTKHFHNHDYSKENDITDRCIMDEWGNPKC